MVKRVFDLGLALPALVLLSPLMLLIALLVRIDSPGPVLFVQERVGLGGRPFGILKFRTMRQSPRGEGLLITSARDRRITRVGTFLRRWKLDELPQLVNVVWGDMSLVGPRPEVPRYVAHYSEEQRRVLEVRPGLTDPASLAFRNENDLLAASNDPETLYLERIMPAKLELSRSYIENRSLLFDLRIVLATVGRVLLPGRLLPTSFTDGAPRAPVAEGAARVQVAEGAPGGSFGDFGRS